MDSAELGLQDILSAIDASGLPHLEVALLRAFVCDAVDPSSAANYLHERMSRDEHYDIVSNWVLILDSVTYYGRALSSPDAKTQAAIRKRDGHTCCITGKRGTVWDRLIVVPIMPIPTERATEKSGVSDMLGAFLGIQYRDWWFSCIDAPDSIIPERIFWLVRTSAAQAFASGLVKLNRLQSSMIEFVVHQDLVSPLDPKLALNGRYALLGDRSRSGIIKLDARFIGTHARLCRSRKFRNILKHQATSRLLAQNPSVPARRGIPKAQTSTCIRAVTSFLGNCVLGVWVRMPVSVRLSAYEILIKLGKLCFGENEDMTVHRLPFGLFLKSTGDLAFAHNEYNALSMVRTLTEVRVPKPLDIVSDSTDPSSRTYLLMTRIRGFELWGCQYILSDRDCAEIAEQLKDCLEQLRSIPNDHSSAFIICNTLGRECRDHRISWADPFGPFSDEESFSKLLRFSDDPFRRGHRAFFTHSDLNPRNVLVDRYIKSDGSYGWEITGIVDWETAGFFPEYWEYTKAMFEGFRWTRRYNEMIANVFKEFGDYSGELDVERRSWESGDAV